MAHLQRLIGLTERQDLLLELPPLALLLLDVLDVPAQIVQALGPDLVAAKGKERCREVSNVGVQCGARGRGLDSRVLQLMRHRAVLLHVRLPTQRDRSRDVSRRRAPSTGPGARGAPLQKVRDAP